MITLANSNQNTILENENHPHIEENEYHSSEENESTESESEGEENGAIMSVEDIAKVKPSFGNISVTNSSDVHFGSKTFYQGPVTIKQFVYAKNAITDGEISEQDSDGATRDKRLILDCVLANGEKINNGFVGGPDDDKINTNENIDHLQSSHKLYKQNEVRHKWLQGLSKHQSLYIGLLAVAFILSLVILTVLLSLKHYPLDITKYTEGKDEDYIGTPIDSPVDPNAFNSTLTDNVKIISRLEWVAQPPVEPANDLNLPVPYVIIWHTATENCSDQAACVFHVRYIQSYHIESRHWWDIGYNFLVGGDGNAYEGRGWKKEGAHTFDYNKRSIGIAFIGTFISIKPPPWQINACKVLIKIGVKKGYIAKDYKLLAAKQLTGTQAPGAALYEDIKTWPHWSELP